MVLQVLTSMRQFLGETSRRSSQIGPCSMRDVNLVHISWLALVFAYMCTRGATVAFVWICRPQQIMFIGASIALHIHGQPLPACTGRALWEGSKLVVGSSEQPPYRPNGVWLGIVWAHRCKLPECVEPACMSGIWFCAFWLSTGLEEKVLLRCRVHHSSGFSCHSQMDVQMSKNLACVLKTASVRLSSCNWQPAAGYILAQRLRHNFWMLSVFLLSLS